MASCFIIRSKKWDIVLIKALQGIRTKRLCRDVLEDLFSRTGLHRGWDIFYRARSTHPATVHPELPVAPGSA